MSESSVKKETFGFQAEVKQLIRETRRHKTSLGFGIETALEERAKHSGFIDWLQIRGTRTHNAILGVAMREALGL